MDDITKSTKILPADFRDPFYRKKIYGFSVTYAINPVSGIWEAYGNVQMADQNTYGGHNFQGKSFDDVVLQIKAFIDNLPK